MHSVLYPLNPWWIKDPASSTRADDAAAAAALKPHKHQPLGAAAAPIPIDRSHEDMVRELDELLRANDRTCEKSDNEIWADEEPPMFLRRTG